ncbi:glycosyltransferase family 2 protein [Paenibacillus rigui]|uniref:Glycosyltransferase n=1 Tax=Paenibacillus rigui TaxID=554312 RepID=A0A229UVZ5_9BACL|nr:glycosyltransferase family 2 protein [Paenibacillus rigui]OXM87461.1 glycosyltransferase [Paenibacillus rigui]
MLFEPIRYSVIVPMFNEQEVIVETYRRLKCVMDTLGEPYELLLVNDGSRDRTAEIVNGIIENDANVKMISFARNFGHQVAISAGMDHAQGQAVVVIDADLQDPPEVIVSMIGKWKEGYDVVYGKRVERRGETWFKRVTAHGFYRLLKALTSVDIPVDTGDFRLIDRKVCDVLKSLTERNRYVRGLVSWVGFRQTSVEYIREERWAGETKYPLGKMLRFALDAITSFSYKPLKLAGYLGFTLSAVSFLYLMIIMYQKLFTDTTITGWASIVAVNLFFNGVMLIILGIIGEYIGRIYDESKGRPLYIIRDKSGYGAGTGARGNPGSDAGYPLQGGIHSKPESAAVPVPAAAKERYEIFS